MPQIDLEQDVLDVLVEQVYARWVSEFDLKKKVKEEKNDGSPDWELMHIERMKNHTASFDKWNKIYTKCAPLHSMAIASRKPA